MKLQSKKWTVACTWRTPWLLGVICVAMLCSGCSYKKTMDDARKMYTAGNFQGAAASVSKAAQKEIKSDMPQKWEKDAIAYLLDAASLRRAAGEFQASNKLLTKAMEGMDYFDDEAPEISLSNELASVVINQAATKYRGYVQDRVMAGTYMALNALQTGDRDNVLPALKRANRAQEELVEKKLARIEKAQSKIKENEKGVDWGEADKSRNGSEWQSNEDWKAADAELQQHVPDLSASGGYRNPYMMYLYGLIGLGSTDRDDQETARKFIESVQGLIGANKFIEADRAAVVAAQAGNPLEPTTYVFFETGLAPRRGEVNITIPFFIRNNKGTHTYLFPIVFPVLKFQKDFVHHLQVQAGSTTERTTRLASMDKLIAREFKDEQPLIITKALASGAVKLTAQIAADQAKGDAGTALQIVSRLYAGATNQADLRTWQTLPKEVQFCRISTPQDRRITIIVPGANQQHQSVTVEPGTMNIVIVRSISRGTPVTISQARIK
ncbi:MAG: hypothetical protein FWD53_02380 [Phycisphaerales bacterium]|nr:hypothetical protein [Phycisphaerales bacterium]